MKCPDCDGKVEMIVNVTMLIPAELEGQLSKANLRRKDVKLYGASWDKAAYFCKNNKCRWRFKPIIIRRD